MSTTRRHGLILGKAVGDALGAGVETCTPEVATVYVKEVLRPLKIPHKTPKNRPFGQYTDDTQMARELLLCVREVGTLNPQELAHHWSDFVLSGKLVGGGRTTQTAAEAFKAGTPWQEAGSPRPSNGSAMRAAVLALLDTDTLTQSAVDQSRITHTADAAQAASVLMATAAHLALTQDKLDKTHFLEALAKEAAPIDANVHNQLDRLNDYIRLKPMDVLEKLYYQLDLPAEWRKYPGVAIHATEATLWALYAFLKYPDEYMAVVGTAISGGGDTDTTAAMAGALSGARLGIDALPRIYVDVVHDAGDWQAHKLTELVDSL